MCQMLHHRQEEINISILLVLYLTKAAALSSDARRRRVTCNRHPATYFAPPNRRERFTQRQIGGRAIYLAITCTTAGGAGSAPPPGDAREGRQRGAAPLFVRFLYRMRWPQSLHRITSCGLIAFSAPQSVRGQKVRRMMRGPRAHPQRSTRRKDRFVRPQMYLTAASRAMPPPPEGCCAAQSPPTGALIGDAGRDQSRVRPRPGGAAGATGLLPPSQVGVPIKCRARPGGPAGVVQGAPSDRLEARRASAEHCGSKSSSFCLSCLALLTFG